MDYELTVNSRIFQGQCDPDTTLFTILRKLGFLSVKTGCDTENCGLCTVWVDEKPVLSCSYPVMRASGRNITTLEGVEKEALEFGEFLAGEGAEQCGFCSPGFIMTVLAMKKELNHPSREEITHYLAGNLCRCTGYMGQTRAIMKYLDASVSTGKEE